MKKLQLLVYLILLSLIIMAIVNGNKQGASECAIHYGEISSYDEQLFWKEDGICCRYALIDNMIKEKCEDG